MKIAFDDGRYIEVEGRDKEKVLKRYPDIESNRQTVKDFINGFDCFVLRDIDKEFAKKWDNTPEYPSDKVVIDKLLEFLKTDTVESIVDEIIYMDIVKDYMDWGGIPDPETERKELEKNDINPKFWRQSWKNK